MDGVLVHDKKRSFYTGKRIQQDRKAFIATAHLVGVVQKQDCKSVVNERQDTKEVHKVMHNSRKTRIVHQNRFLKDCELHTKRKGNRESIVKHIQNEDWAEPRTHKYCKLHTNWKGGQ